MNMSSGVEGVLSVHGNVFSVSGREGGEYDLS